MNNEEILQSIAFLLAADGSIGEQELHFFHSACQFYGISAPQETAILESARQGRAKVYLPESDVDRKRLLSALVQAVGADEEVAPQEREILEIVGTRIGVSRVVVDGMIQDRLRKVKTLHEPMRVSGYPLSQAIISGVFALLAVLVFVFVKVPEDSEIPILWIRIAAAITWVCAMYALLDYPYIVVTISAEGDWLTVHWSRYLGLIRKRREIPSHRIKKVVYLVTHYRVQEEEHRTAFYSKPDLYLELVDGERQRLLPSGNATRGLSQKVGEAIAGRLGIEMEYQDK